MFGISISSHIDKMNISFKHCAKFEDMIPAAPNLLSIEEEMHPFPHYHKAYRLKCGGIANLSDDHRQGARLDMGGDAFHALRSTGITDAKWLQITDTWERKRWTTRIDYCFNLHGGSSQFVEETLSEWDRKDKTRCKTKFRNEPEVFDNRRNDKGMTIYYGSRKGDKLVRVYDKAAEMNLLQEAWTRVELKLNKPHSAAFVVDARENDLQTVGRSWLLELIDFPCLEWWNFMVCGDTIEPRDARKHQAKFWAWANKDFLGWVRQRALNGERAQAEDFVANAAYMLAELDDQE